MNQSDPDHHRPPGMSRRRFVARTSAASAALMLASGCRDGVRPTATTIRFWNGFTGPDGRTMLRIIKQFNAQHDDVQIVMQRIDWNTYFNKLFVAGLGGRAPEVFVVPMHMLERFFTAGLLDPIDSAFSTGIDPADIDANVLAPTRRDGKTYALPLDVFPAGVYYNKRLFAAANIAKPPETRAQFIDALHKLKRTDDAGASQWGFVYEWLMVQMYTLVRQFDGTVLDGPDLRTVTLHSPNTRRAMAFAASLIQDLKLVPPIENLSGFLSFRQGRVGMIWAGIFMLSDAQRQTDLDFGTAPIPVVGDRPAVWGGSHNLCVSVGLSERTRSAADRLLRFLSDHSLAWAAAGQVPARRSIRALDAFKAMPAQAMFARQIPILEYMPSTPFSTEYVAEFDVASEAILRGRPVDATLSAAAQRIRQTIARYGRFPAKTAGGAA